MKQLIFSKSSQTLTSITVKHTIQNSATYRIQVSKIYQAKSNTTNIYSSESYPSIYSKYYSSRVESSIHKRSKNSSQTKVSRLGGRTSRLG